MQAVVEAGGLPPLPTDQFSTGVDTRLARSANSVLGTSDQAPGVGLEPTTYGLQPPQAVQRMRAESRALLRLTG
jgi:hypothetical protein